MSPAEIESASVSVINLSAQEHGAQLQSGVWKLW